MSSVDDVPTVLLGLARDDELAAHALLNVEGVTDAILGFHTQQAVEKSLKAVLAHSGNRVEAGVLESAWLPTGRSVRSRAIMSA